MTLQAIRPKSDFTQFTQEIWEKTMKMQHEPRETHRENFLLNFLILSKENKKINPLNYDKIEQAEISIF